MLANLSTVEDLERFTRSRSVGVHMGLTPRQYQSGDVDRSGRISKCGDMLARTLLYEATVEPFVDLGLSIRRFIPKSATHQHTVAGNAPCLAIPPQTKESFNE